MPCCLSNSSINKEEATGKIHTKDNVADFAYKMEFKSGKLKPTGKFIYNNDTFAINAVEETIKKGKTLGILGMKERAVLLGGELEMIGIPNKGTSIKLKLPLT